MRSKITSRHGRVEIIYNPDGKTYTYQIRDQAESTQQFNSAKEAALAADLSEEEASAIQFGNWVEDVD